MTDEFISAVFQKPFEEALTFFRAKVPLPTNKWNDVAEDYQALAFTIAGITRLNILKDVQDAISQQLEKGISPEQFREEFQDIMTRRGWNPNFSPKRIDLILNQNIRNAHQYGRWQQMRSEQMLKRRPYWQWVHGDSPNPRPHHLTQDGKVYPANADIWKSIHPSPFGCRCRAFPLSQRDLDREGLTVSEPPSLSSIAEKGFTKGFSDDLEAQRLDLVKQALDSLPPSLRRFLEEIEYLEFYDPSQPRDRAGKFAKKGSRAGQKPNRPTLEELTEKGMKERIKRYKEDSNLPYLRISTLGSYQDIKQALGESEAERALEEFALLKARAAAVDELKLMDIQDERDAILGSKNKQLKTELAAKDRLRPDLRYSSTLEEFKTNHPNMDEFMEQYKEELRLDKVLSYNATLKRGEQLTKNLDALFVSAQTESAQLEVISRFRDDLISSGLDRQKAIKLVDSIEFDRSMDEDGTTRRVTARSATEFYQLTGGLGKKHLEKFERKEDRAYADSSKKKIDVGLFTSRETVWHEMGHHVEFEDTRIAAAAREWRDKRATGSVKKLKELTSGNYEDNEIAVPGNFVSPYVGKIYKDGGTEVISMGLERFSSPESMWAFYQDDKEHFQFILGVIHRD